MKIRRMCNNQVGHIFLIGFFLLGACQESEPSGQNAAKGYTHEQAQEILDNLANTLVSDPQWTAVVSANESQEPTFSLAKVTTEFPEELVIDGVSYRVSLSLLDIAHFSSLNKNLGSERFGIILDPDRFYADLAEAPIRIWNNGRVEIASYPLIPEDDNVTLSADEEKQLADRKAVLRTAFDFPIFSIDIDQAMDNAEIDRNFREMVKQQLDGLGKGAYQANYITIKKVQMRSKKDDGKAELELYYGVHSNNSGRINSTTIHKFDGATRYDAAGRSVKYENVNYNTTYEMSNDIAIWPIDGITFRMVGIEDDNDAGEFERSNSLFIYPIATTYFSMASGAILRLDWDYTSVGTEGHWDDVYDRSGVDDITTAALAARLGTNSYLVVDASSQTYGQSHINWTVGLKGY